MRRVFAFIFYLAMISLGSWCAYEWLVLGGRGITFRLGSFLAVFGPYLLWADFISPRRERV
jgi:hypothetical protein